MGTLLHRHGSFWGQRIGKILRVIGGPIAAPEDVCSQPIMRSPPGRCYQIGGLLFDQLCRRLLRREREGLCAGYYRMIETARSAFVSVRSQR
jgi:hypothetical protein